MGARTSFFVKSSATATRATAVYTTAAVLDHTPADNSSILYIAGVEILGSTAGRIYDGRLNQNTQATVLSQTNYSPPVATSALTYVYSPLAVVSYGAAPGAQSISIDVKSSALTDVLQRSNAFIWGLQLGDNDQFVIGTDTFATVTSQTWATVGSQLNVSVATSGAWLILSYAEASAQFQGSTNTSQTTQIRMVFDGSAAKKVVLNKYGAAFDMMNYYVYAGIESFTAGAHTINMQASYSGAPNANTSKVRRVRHVALEVSGFARTYIDTTSVGVSASALAFTTVASFAPNINDTKKHVELFYHLNAGPQGASNINARTRILRNTEDIGEHTTRIMSSATGSIAGTEGNPFIIVNETTVTSGVVNNYHVLTKQDSNGIDFHVIENRLVFIAQLDAASAGGGGGPVTYDNTVTGVGTGVASVIKTVGVNRVAIGRAVASVEANEILRQLLSAVAVANASITFNSQFRTTLSAVANAIASISSRTTRAQTLTAVANAIATFSSRTTRVKDLVALANSIANAIKTVNKKIETQGNAVADAQAGFFVSLGAVGNAVATLNEATIVTAPGSVAVTANPYVLSLGDSVKRFKSLLQHGAGLGRGTTSDRDPDS